MIDEYGFDIYPSTYTKAAITEVIDTNIILVKTPSSKLNSITNALLEMLKVVLCTLVEF